MGNQDIQTSQVAMERPSHPRGISSDAGQRTSQLGIHWKRPTVMFVLFIAAVVTAIGHHIFYDTLDGEAATHQEQNLRIGTALSLFSRIFLAASVSIALAQRSWSTVQSRSLTLGAVDDLFMVPFSMTKLFNGELLKKAKIALLLAIIVFVAPILTVITPGTLIVVPHTLGRSGTVNFSNLDFTRNETDLSAQDLDKIVSFERTENKLFKDMSGGVGTPGYDGPSSRARALIYQTAYGGEVIHSPSPCGANCSFVQSFEGPSYKCTALDPYDASAPWCVEQAKRERSCEETINTGTDPVKAQTYEARNSSEYFSTKYYGTLPWTEGNDEWMDGILWVRHRYLLPEWRSIPEGKVRPNEAWLNFTFRCEQWDTRFDLRQTYVDLRGNTMYNIR